MAPDAVGAGKNGGRTTTTSSSSSSSSCPGRHGLKKGPWTAGEDAILIEYVKKHGEGNWNAVQRNSGLMRCGKSCRLRWANHLRPNLKKGAFCSEEEALIVDLHSKIGNKWARMAAQLPGRTDNEIKNYWNTRLKRRLRAGLPIYPHDVSGGGGKIRNYYRHHHNQQHRQHQQQQQQQENNIQTINNNPSSLSSSPLTSFLSLPPPQIANGLNPTTGYRTPLSLFDIFDPNSISTMKVATNGGGGGSYLPNPTCNNQPFNNIIGGSLALSLSSESQPLPPTSLSSSLPNSLLLPMPNCIQYNNNCMNFETDLMTTTMMSPNLIELPSIQPFAPRASTTTTTPTSSENNGSSDDYNMIATTSSITIDLNDHEEEDFLMRENSTGLLGDMIDESQALTRSNKSKDIISMEPPPQVMEIKSPENYLWDYKVMEGLSLSQYNNGNNVIHDKHVQDSISSMGASDNNIVSSPGASNPVDDDFLGLLDNFPMSVPVPNWCNENEITSNGQDLDPCCGSLITEKENQNQNQEHKKLESSDNFLVGATSKNATTTTTMKEEHNFDIEDCYWKNMPGIYQK